MTCLGFLPRHDITWSRPHLQGVPNPCLVPPSGDLSLSVIYSASKLVSLFHPTAKFRFFAYPGASPFVQLYSLIESRDPLLFPCGPLTGKPAATATFAAPRLCSARRSVLCTRGLTAYSVAPLIRFLASPGRTSDNRTNYLLLDIHVVDYCGLHRSVRHCNSTPTFCHLKGWLICLRFNRPAQAFEPSKLLPLGSFVSAAARRQTQEN